ncbi:hypothetical protein GCM10009554_09000 [Kribbella koreensis]|uniref:Transmembrane protein n=2 Tax=Kribbella TaxID=182639 RepID=A0ABP6YZ12_9ACTN
MSTTQHHPTELRAVMFLRRFGLGHNRLRRASDRAESFLLLAVMFAGLLLVPVAAAVGTSIAHSFEQTAAQRRAELTSVQAHTLEDTAVAVPAAPGQLATRVRVGWDDEYGFPHEAWANVVIGSKAGSTVTVWLDRTGAVVPAPRQPADSQALGAGAGLVMVMVGWPLLWVAFRLLRLPLDRRRARAWEREWAEIAPRWKKSQS